MGDLGSAIPLVAAAVGRRAGEIRRAAAGVRQDDVARAARLQGLGWSQSSVATLEAGKRDLTFSEVVLLPTILTDACKRTITLDELIARDGTGYRLTDVSVIPGWALREVLAGTRAADASQLLLIGRDVNAAEDPAPEPAVMQRLVDLGLEEAFRGYDGYFHSVDDATVKAARKLGEPPLVVAVLSFALWERPLADVRDRVVARRSDAGEDPARLRALRGRVTRQITDDLAAWIKQREEIGGTNEERAGPA